MPIYRGMVVHEIIREISRNLSPRVGPHSRPAPGLLALSKSVDIGPFGKVLVESILISQKVR